MVKWRLVKWGTGNGLFFVLFSGFQVDEGVQFYDLGTFYKVVCNSTFYEPINIGQSFI